MSSKIIHGGSIPLDHALISQDVFMAVMWSMTALVTVLVSARMAIRFKTVGRLQWDDALVILALSILLTMSILWQFTLHYIYDQYAVVRGEKPFDRNFLRDWDYFMHFVVPNNILFYSSLWAIKFSFLIFFRKLGNQIRCFIIWWWIVTVITAIAYIGSVADIHWQCTAPASDIIYILENCASLDAIKWENRTFEANCALDVITDCLILSIPVLILWNVRISLRKKVILFSVFGATIAIMVVAIIRVTIVHSTTHNAEIAWLYFWSFIESATSILIACIASFRQLFVATHENGNVDRRHGNSTRISPNSSRFYNSTGLSTKISLAGFKWSSIYRKMSVLQENERQASEDYILPLEFVTIATPQQSHERKY